MVGGEKKDDTVAKERRRKRKLFADERKQKLAGIAHDFMINVLFCMLTLVCTVYLILYICIFFSLQNSEAIANMDDDFILLQIYDETQDEVRDKDLEVRKIEAKVQKMFITTMSILLGYSL